MNLHDQDDTPQKSESLIEVESKRTRQAFVRTLITAMMAIGISVSMMIAGWKLYLSIDWGSLRSVWMLLFAFLLAIAYRVVNSFGWTLVLRGLGTEVSSVAATRVWLLAESSRWLPGTIWGYVSRASMAKSIGVNSSQAVASIVIELLLVVAAACLVAIPGGLYFYKPLMQIIVSANSGPAIAICVGCTLLLLAVVALNRSLIKKKLNDFVSKFSMLQQTKLNSRSMWFALAFFFAMSVFNGVISWIVSQSVTDSVSVPMLAVLSATSAAWLVGFFAVFSPGGLVVRESAFAAMLLVWLPYSESIAIAVLARLLQFGAEAVTIVWLVAVVRRRAENSFGQFTQ